MAKYINRDNFRTPSGEQFGIEYSALMDKGPTMLDRIVTREAMDKVTSLIGPREFVRGKGLTPWHARISGEILGSVFGPDAIRSIEYKRMWPSSRWQVHVKYQGQNLVFTDHPGTEDNRGSSFIVSIDHKSAGLRELDGRRICFSAVYDVEAYLNHIDIVSIYKEHKVRGYVSEAPDFSAKVAAMFRKTPRGKAN